LVKAGRQKFTVMFIPHSEKKVFNFRISVFALVFLGFMLTAIVVGVCVMALALVLVYRLYLKFGTLDIREIERKAWKLDD
ncbi:MAG TPA: NADH-quinone oxidoreductase subunit K, partial [Candidatus Sabulitectum sp.]|nr:NADH-quinone oxidoreductase subunit K [Candidatus Sabulitectum sp.]